MSVPIPTKRKRAAGQPWPSNPIESRRYGTEPARFARPGGAARGASKVTYRYRAFGRSIVSDFEVPEFWPEGARSLSQVDDEIRIERGNVPPALGPGSLRSGGFQILGREIMLAVPGVGRFLATDGRLLTIETEPGADMRAVRLYLKGSGLAAVFHQRGEFPLHASAIEHAGGCIAFLGDSGAGKSTLAATLAQRGYRVLSDDVLVAKRAAGGILTGAASLPVLKLWPDSLPAVGFAEAQAPFEAGEYRKHHISAPGHFVDAQLPIRRLYLLSWMLPESSNPEIAPVAPFEAMLALRPNVFRSELVSAMGRDADYLHFASALMGNVQVFTYNRGCSLDRMGSHVDALERHLRA